MKKGLDTFSPQPIYSSGEFYKIVRLKTGESIACIMNRNIKSISSEIYLTLQKPLLVTIKKVLNQQENTQVEIEEYIFKTWIGASDSEEFDITTEIVLTVGDMKERVRENYLEFWKEYKRQEQKQKRQELEEKMKREEEEIEMIVSGLLISLSTNGEYRILHEEE